jgi:GGDEF domain-containing protein
MEWCSQILSCRDYSLLISRFVLMSGVGTPGGGEGDDEVIDEAQGGQDLQRDRDSRGAQVVQEEQGIQGSDELRLDVPLPERTAQFVSVELGGARSDELELLDPMARRSERLGDLVDLVICDDPLFLPMLAMRRLMKDFTDELGAVDISDEGALTVFFERAHELRRELNTLAYPPDVPLVIPTELAEFQIQIELFLGLDFSGKGIDFIRKHFELIDEFAIPLLNEGDLSSSSVVRTCGSVRRHPSMILAQAGIARVNSAVQVEDNHFLTGFDLDDSLRDEFESLFDENGEPLSLDKDGDHDLVFFQQWIVRVLKYRLLQLPEDIRDEGKKLIWDDFVRESVISLDRMGPLRPGIKDLLDLSISQSSSALFMGHLGSSDPSNQLKGMVQQLEKMGLQDMVEHLSLSGFVSKVTELPNEQAFDRDCLDFMVPNTPEGEKRYKRKWVLMLDLNGFKAVNDDSEAIMRHSAALGKERSYQKYELGDLVLYLAGQRMQSVLRPGQKLYHWHGDEFSIVLDGDLDEEVVMKVLRDLNFVLHQLSEELNIRNKFNGTRLMLGIAGGALPYSPKGYGDDLSMMKTVVAALMDKNKKTIEQGDDAGGEIRSFEEKCGLVLDRVIREKQDDILPRRIQYVHTEEGGSLGPEPTETWQ